LPNLEIHKVATGTKIFDWEVPKEWSIKNAWIKNPAGVKICEYKKCKLHVVGYSVPVHKKLTLEKLQNHLHSIPDKRSAIPYVTSYYKENWGFCLSQKDREKLKNGIYEVFIDSSLFDGHLSYGELVIEGYSKKEIFLSTYICHPLMANDGLSGPAVTTFLSKWLTSLKTKKYTHRVVFIPETIGSLVYLNKHLKHLKKHVIAGFNITCIGDDRAYSYLPSREGNTLSDKVANHVLSSLDKNFLSYEWSDRGSDERQYCAPLVNLPIASIYRSKIAKYDEYHTSLDDLENVVTSKGLLGGYQAIKLALEAIEQNGYPLIQTFGEPQLGKRGLYPNLSNNKRDIETKLLMNVISWSDGTKSLIDIANLCKIPVWKIYPIIEKLKKYKLIDVLNKPLN